MCNYKKNDTFNFVIYVVLNNANISLNNFQSS